MKRAIILIQLTALTLSLAADTIPRLWSLSDCIDYAMEHNIDIRRSVLASESAQEDIKAAKSDFLPELNGSIGQRVVFSPYSPSGETTSYSGSYGIDAGWVVYNGGKRLNTLRQSKLSGQIAELSVNENRLAIEESIAQLYIQILYSSEAVAVNDSMLALSRQEYARARQLFSAGSISASDLAQMEAQVSNSNYQLVVSQNTLDDYYLQLRQLLELSPDTSFLISTPDLSDSTLLAPLPDKDDVYSAALSWRPEIEASELNLQSSALSVATARSAYIPTISLSAGIGTSHATGTDFTFSEQVKRNWDNSIGLTLSIPIYDRRSTTTAVRKAKIQQQTDQLNLIDARKILYQTIETLWLSARSARLQYTAALDNLRSTEAGYALVSEQFAVGLKNTVELLTEKNNLLSARRELLQAKYTAILNTGLLHLYQGSTFSNTKQ